ncbi:uncharacterized protein LOC120316181 isoform X2 [Crotalus tigris]|uniref:uncharacterized protein LOC120316181 isoform X2 n=1 Tax=Crotalus tigris TaxID=88082 RepID=UPI00192FA7BC|nr:uncharacterized protein LOC120316181 isoform X2 [Crotalus tigris]XP_039217411.1 uncharacterized protein LOC120316181 isoform X2 [Crotalus tigris]
MDSRGSGSPSFQEPRSSMSDNLNYGDEELDEETMNFISALYTALGPLLPEVTKLQGHQDPPAHLMVDMKTKLRELGSSVSDARKRLLKYNIYLKKKLARAMQERKALREQQLRQQGINEQLSTAHVPSVLRAEVAAGKSRMGTEKNILEIPPAELVKLKQPERIHRRGDTVEERARMCMTPQGILQRNICKVENASSRPLDRSSL